MDSLKDVATAKLIVEEAVKLLEWWDQVELPIMGGSDDAESLEEIMCNLQTLLIS